MSVKSRVAQAILVRAPAADLARYAGQRVNLCGWLQTRRALGAVTFLVVRDYSGLAQAVVGEPELLTRLDGALAESVLCLSGQVVADERARGGAELRVDELKMLSAVGEALPFEINKPLLKPALDIWLDRAALACATNRSVLRYASWRRWRRGFRAALLARDFVEIFTPKLVGAATEGGANVFPVEYFGRKAYLAQSPQLYKQMLVGVHERVFEIGPVFRAEPHATTRHLNEYVSLDLEYGFINDHRDVMHLAQDVVREMMQRAAERHAAELRLFETTAPIVDEIPIIAFHEAQELILREHGVDCRDELDLAPQHERWLGAWAAREHGSDFVFVEGYPTAKRPFYTMPNPTQPAVSNSFDLLFRGLEVITGGQREHRLDHLTRVMAERGVDPAPFDGYLDAFRYGMPPEGGCAFGLERFAAQLLGVGNVREVTAFPRDINRLTP